MAGRKSSASNIKMPDVNALFGLEDSNGKTEAKVVEIAIDQLYSFDSHPFRVLDDEKMQETVESVREHGIICPLIVRPGKEGGYEIIAGHRRKRACELLGLKTVPCFIRNLTDEEAIITMVDASSGVSSCLPEQFFEKEPWYVRLALEGEDRLEHNQRAKEQERTASYSAISEEWQVMGNLEGNPLKHLVERENLEEILQCLTERQKTAVSLCFFQQKTQREAAKELGITCPAVSAILSQAARRLRKKYPPQNQAEKAVAAV